jgi:hypothetical protein
MCVRPVGADCFHQLTDKIGSMHRSADIESSADERGFALQGHDALPAGREVIAYVPTNVASGRRQLQLSR